MRDNPAADAALSYATPPRPLRRSASDVARAALGRLYPPSWSKILGFLALCVLAALFVMPFLWMIGTSLTPASEIINVDRPFFPARPAWENYREALTTMPFNIFL